MSEPIKSPYIPNNFSRLLTPEKLKKIKELLGVSCVFVVSQKDKCDCKDVCNGHFLESSYEGFTKHGIHAMMHSFIDADHKEAKGGHDHDHE